MVASHLFGNNFPILGEFSDVFLAAETIYHDPILEAMAEATATEAMAE